MEKNERPADWTKPAHFDVATNAEEALILLERTVDSSGLLISGKQAARIVPVGPLVEYLSKEEKYNFFQFLIENEYL